MKYLCMIYVDEKRLASMPEDEIEAAVSNCEEYRESLEQNGQMVAAARLAPTMEASTIRPRNGSNSVTDGPFAETKEQLGGFYLIDARDLNEAIRIASHIPPARLGCVEVRPIQQLDISSPDMTTSQSATA